MAGKDQAAGPPLGHSKGAGALLPGIYVIARGTLLAMRPVQWTKSLLVFLPLAFSVGERWSWNDASLLSEFLIRAVEGALVFCALSGAVYIINDIFDREKDRNHPRKRRRPIASGQLPVAVAATVALLLLGLSLAGSFLLDTGFGIVCVVYIAMHLGYSSLLKRIIILDVMIVGVGYLLRVVAGAFVIDVTVSPWLYTTIGLGALFIALGKRYSELKLAGSNAGDQRVVLDQYSREFLSQVITVTGAATLVTYALYTFTARNVPDDHSMMLTVPFVIFGLLRYLYLVNQTDDAESPELVIIKDKPLLADVLLWAVTAIVILTVSR